MKKGILYLILFVFLFSCDNNDDDNSSETELIGTWKLIENYADPGDGSGDFEVVVSEKIIEFFNDGSVISNGSICDMSIESSTPSSGTYSEAEFIINSSECLNFVDFDIMYFFDESFLIISYPCIEGCLSKYEKIQ
jgi:hypothetical protein